MFFAYGEAELACLRARDKRLCEVIDKIGHVDRVVDTDLFSAVVHHIIGQQISTKAQATIWQRMQDALGTVNAETILAAGVPKLQALGMTFRKAEYITDFAERVHSGAFDPEGIRQKSDEDAIRELSALKGIGVWTAEMILLFCMQRPDVLSGWSTTTAKLTASCLKSTAAGSAPIAAWPACTCGPWQAERSRKCAIISRKPHDKKGSRPAVALSTGRLFFYILNLPRSYKALLCSSRCLCRNFAAQRLKAVQRVVQRLVLLGKVEAD